MLYLLFQLGEDRYALEARRVVEVLPLVTLKHLPQSPPGVAGLFRYHGQAIPAVDLTRLATGQPARDRLSTRIILVNYDIGGAERRDTRDGSQPENQEEARCDPATPTFDSQRRPMPTPPRPRGLGLLGLIAENATEMLRRDPGDFVEPGLAPAWQMSSGWQLPPYLGPVLVDDKGVIQLVREQRLLTAPLRDAIFRGATALQGIGHAGNEGESET